MWLKPHREEFEGLTLDDFLNRLVARFDKHETRQQKQQLFAAATLQHFGGVPFETAIACRQRMRASAEQLSYANSSIMYEYINMFEGWMRDGLQRIMRDSKEDIDYFIQEARQYLADHASIMKDPIESRKISTRREIVEYMIRNDLPKELALAALQDPHLLSPLFSDSSKDKPTKSAFLPGSARPARSIPNSSGGNPKFRSQRRFPGTTQAS